MTGLAGFSIGKNTAECLLRKSERGAARRGTLGIESAAATTAIAVGASTSLDAGMTSFRHFLAQHVEPLPCQAHDTRTPEEKVAQSRAIAKDLADVAARTFPWNEHSSGIKSKYPGIEKWENHKTPSGYTYLLQLIAHDIVATSYPVSAGMPAARNMRLAPLQLDTIYGGGPADCPLVYALDEKAGTPRTELRLGAIAADPNDTATDQPRRDIARVSAPELDAQPAQEPKSLSEALIADPRNDSNAAVSQLTALFHTLHNAIVGMLPSALNEANADDAVEAAFKRFLCARGAVTLIYRRIIRRDLLERILHPAIYELYKGPAPDFLEKDAASPGADGRIPLEFSAAAFRFGHAMIRPIYRFNETAKGSNFTLIQVLQQTSAQRPTDMPFSKDWLVRWGNFFEIDGSRPNFSQRISSYFSPHLQHQFFPAIDKTDRVGLPYRDFLSGGLLNLPTAQQLIAAIEKVRPGLIERSAFLKDGAYRATFKAFLDETKVKQQIFGLPVDRLVERTPLAFFIVLEAALDPEVQGFKLGLLGSIIVAEVMHAAMARNPVDGELDDGLADALDRLCRDNAYPQNFLQTVPEIDSMAALVKFAAQSAQGPSFI